MLADKIDGLTAKISTLSDCLEKRDEYINEIEKRLTTVERNYDRLEQYSPCSNIRFHGIDEMTAKVIAIANGIVKVEPPIGIGDIVTSQKAVCWNETQACHRSLHCQQITRRDVAGKETVTR